MKAQVKDKIWARLSELAPRDVDGATSARIRERALLALCRRPPSSTEVIARRAERIWTDFVELPMVGGVIVACLFWLVQGMTWARFENSESLAGRAREVDTAHDSYYARAFLHFEQQFMSAIDRRTILVIFGDGRTSFQATGADVVAEMRAGARNVLWLCPEPRSRWGAGDSAMPAFAAEVTQPSS